ncbi:hypothetical protein PR202_ga01880 [Eleusine coracana subsp. coracana]|uniref:Protein kinase domain-containing protein n=1 Tax=Eleusine coracana subsp. coracana TaxID=191504 RepID=A0AAV5BJG5_ELECO|nr:hypothetical protein PR202_ga01193 [Eleusine coracana subsp. coracana]GJM86062.1 hypothetical protein PR202_ga01880 [Eleusine coracana subsp. coracana]
MECLAEMPRAPLDRRPRKRQRMGWDVGPAEFNQIQMGFCGQEVAHAISAVALGLSSGVVSSQGNQELPRLGSPPLREDDKDDKINAKMGEGTFGQVLECWDRERKEMVAIKIIRGIKKYREAAMIEIGMLEQLGKYEQSRSSCVQIRNWFDYLMHELRLIHTDLKPENILLISPEYIKVPDYKVSSRSPKEGSYYKQVPKSNAIKVIDFGSTTYDQQDQSYVVSTRHYRAPEVILGLGWSYPCDIWSVGCILVELCTGWSVCSFVTPCSRQAEKYIRKGRLNWPEGCTSRESMKAVMKLPRLQNLVMQNVDQSAGDLIDLLQGLLKYDPASRLTAEEALRHPFLTGVSERRR